MEGKSRLKELIKTNNAVTLSYVEALLRDSNIPFQALDLNMSTLEGSLGILPRRILVDEDHEMRARQLMKDAGLDHETSPASKSR
ncbi:MAG: DUF2007 domain-containing protein [Cohaesibacter sp.]|nr:DUF2007 domain-containing protein [Cohaesibacter sp.]